MVKGCGNACMKFILFTFNFIFVAIGATLIGLGGYVLSQNKDLRQVLESPDTTAILVIMVGLITFLVAFFGCCGASQESSCMLSTYAVIVGVVFLAEVALAIVLLLYSNEVPTYVKAGIEHTFGQYNRTKGNPLDGAVDFVQSTFECCGVEGKQYWRRERPDMVAHGLPLSCCFKTIEFQTHGSCEDPTQPPSPVVAWSTGCVSAVNTLLRQYIAALAGIMIFAGAIKIIAACFACSLANAVQY